MDKTKEYLAVLAKIMNELPSRKANNKNTYNELFYIINSELKVELQRSLYPNAPEIAERADSALESMEMLFICKEIVGSSCVLVSNYATNKVFEEFPSLFLNGRFVFQIYRIFTQIPIIITNSEDDSIEVLNYANERIQLSTSEYQLLIAESNRRKIALNKIVRLFLIGTKLHDPKTSLISDNIYGNAEKMFERTIGQRVVYIDKRGLATAAKRSLYQFDVIAIDDSLMSTVSTEQTLSQYKHNIISMSELPSWISSKAKPILYGYIDDFRELGAQISEYYGFLSCQSRTTLNEVVGDIVRLGDSGNETLQSLRCFEEARAKSISQESKKIEEIFNRINALVSKISFELDDATKIGKVIPIKVYENVFGVLFSSRYKSDTQQANLQYALSRLNLLEYKDCLLVKAYIQSVSGQTVNWNDARVSSGEWAKAKMLIEVCDIEHMPIIQLKQIVNALGTHMTTGKEYYAKARITDIDSYKIDYLNTSFDKGYEPAGVALLNCYKNGKGQINLKTLANALVPEACVLIAEQQYQKQRRGFASLEDIQFVYYKLAAAKQYLPAIGKIVDLIYESRFSEAFQIPINDKSNVRYEASIENGHAICQLCQFLIAKGYNTEHYSEILGVVWFCLNERHSDSMALLLKSKTGIAYYCLGNMYEFGSAGAKDVKQALSCYEASLNRGFANKSLNKRIEACKGKIAAAKARELNTNYYHSSRSYTPSYTPTSSYSDDESCFTEDCMVLMADNTYKRVSEIAIGDEVAVFDHYEGKISSESIIANVHDCAFEKQSEVLSLAFSNGEILKLVNSHLLFDISTNKYEWIDGKNAEQYIGHEFASIKNGKVMPTKLLSHKKHLDIVRYFTPLSRYHLNVVVDSILTMPPTKITAQIFPITNNMKYDLTVLDKRGVTEYDRISEFISKEEYDNLPCQYLDIVIAQNSELDIQDFIQAMMLYREHAPI